ncbi:MAG TPA: toxin-antitoxin system HicB family antitoxin [Candidatus Scybalocola faecavium]|nr:toxin-antitoxin system HicB family antitoxin [Candidatus Scybalocola faecavium]
MKRLTIVFDDELHKKVKIKAIQQGVSLKEYITRLIEDDFQKEKE